MVSGSHLARVHGLTGQGADQRRCLMRKLTLALALVPIVFGTPAAAATVVDPTGDFLPAYNGPHTGEFDVTSFTALFDPSASLFQLSATLAGTINPATDGYYIIGVNTGAGARAPFG